MKYAVGDKVLFGDKKCKIIATQETPHIPQIDPFNRKEIFPDKGYDYLLFILDKIENNMEYYSGTISVTENQIESNIV